MKSLGKGVVTWSYHQYRSNAHKEYSNVWRALFREFIQNSNDAGAKIISFNIDSKKRIIGVYDDGCGMNLDTIQNKLLVIGGSAKADGSVGGLGKAKELLFFSHPHWTVVTNHHTIKGQGGEYEIFENSNHFEGTLIELIQPEEETLGWNQIYQSLKLVAGRCQIKPEIYVRFDDIEQEKLVTESPRGRKVREIPEMGNLYYTKTIDGVEIHGNDYLRVTINGCWMFEKYIGPHAGFAVFDIDSRRMNPIDGLTANRDSLKHDYAKIIDQLAEELIIDKVSATQKREPTITVLERNGQVDTGVSDKELMDMLNRIENNRFNERPDTERIFVDPLSVERATAFLKEQNTSDEHELCSAIEDYLYIVGYEPDFILREDPDNDDLGSLQIRRFLKTKKATTIAKVWTETVKQVMLDNLIRVRFTAGFIFDNNQALRSEESGRGECYYINPLKVPQTGVQNKVEFMHYMRTTAVHEITHKFVRYHDESFMAKYHALEEKTWPNHRIYANIGKIR